MIDTKEVQQPNNIFSLHQWGECVKSELKEIRLQTTLNIYQTELLTSEVYYVKVFLENLVKSYNMDFTF